MRIKSFRDFNKLNEGGYSYLGDDGDLMDPRLSAKAKPYKIVKHWESDLAIFQNIYTKKYYAFSYGDLDKSEFYDYAYLPFEVEVDEDGHKMRSPLTEYFEFDDENVEEYLNDNLEHLEYGEGLGDYETGNANFILIDEPLKKEIEEVYGEFTQKQP